MIEIQENQLFTYNGNDYVFNDGILTYYKRDGHSMIVRKTLFNLEVIAEEKPNTNHAGETDWSELYDLVKPDTPAESSTIRA